MMRDNYKQICEGKDLRSNLAALRKELSDEVSVREFQKITGGDYRVLYALLQNPDPKVRKNVCSVIGLCRPPKAVGLLWHAYLEEKTLFVRPSYLKALSGYDCPELKKDLQEQERERMLDEPSEEDRKHRLEELAALRQILSRYDEKKKHTFKIPAVTPDMILITNRAQREITAQQIMTGNIRLLAGGIKVSGGDLMELLQIRTVEEYLFPVPHCRPLVGSAEQIGTLLSQAGLPGFLDKLHEEDPNLPYYFRIDVRGQIPPEKKGAFIRRISDTLERRTGAALRGSASDYEIELRLLQKKDGSFVPCLKLFSLPDDRFAYRTGQTSESIAPVNAALAIALARPWLKDGAQVLDPFCGVGTMLIERAKAGRTGMLFGVDHYGQAIRLGKENAAGAGVQINYINRDFLTFTHDHPFDEVITDLPRQCHDELTQEVISPSGLFREFFIKIPSLLKNDALLVLYTPLGEEILSCIEGDPRFGVEGVFPVNEKNGTQVYILRYRSDGRSDFV